MSKATTTVADRRRAIFYMRLQSAFRTSLACIIVGCVILYGPPSVKEHVTFPAFSYVIAIFLVSDAYLGAVIRGCWHALCATLQVVPLTTLSIWVIGLENFSPAMGSLAVALFSFLLALPKSTHLMCKRIAFAQLVIVFVGAVINRENAHDFQITTYPVNVAASTALGAISALFSLLLPFPGLAHREARNLCQLYAENAAERMNLYLNALSAKNHLVAIELLAKAKRSDDTGHKLLQSIKHIQGSIIWEKPWWRFTSPELLCPGDRLQGIEASMKGMRTALESRTSLSDGYANQELNDVILGASRRISLKLHQARSLPSLNSVVPVLETDKINLTLKDNPLITKDLSASFFLLCLQQLIGGSAIQETILEKNTKQEKNLQEGSVFLNINGMYTSWIKRFSKDRLLFASKCSLSLGLAVLTGLVLNKEDGYWSGLTVAFCVVEGRQALFTVSNARVQGTAIGSVYGILALFVLHKYPELKFLALLPWILFTTFLRHSRMYGQTGGSSAIIGAVLVLVKNDYGLANEYAINRLTGAAIGLCYFILVELFLQPNRASTLVKQHLHLTLETLQECIHQLVLPFGSKGQPSINLQAFREKEKAFRSMVQTLNNFIKEAELEPNFWLLPFQESSYKAVHNSFSKMSNLLSCLSYSLEYLLQVEQGNIAADKELQESIGSELNLCKETIGNSLRCLRSISQEQEQKVFHEEERKSSSTENMPGSWTIDIEQATKAGTQLPSSKSVEESPKDVEGDKENKGEVLVSLSIWGYCSGYLTQETKIAEALIKGLLHWE